MGRQLNFWMAQSDEWAFVDRLRQDNAVWTPRALAYQEEPTVHELDDWTPIDSGQRIVVIRRSDWDSLECHHIPKSKYPNDPEFAAWTMVGTGPSPCFEWDTCTRGTDFIARGRIFYRSDWLDGEQVLVKPEEPTRWFDRLTSWLRRRGKKWEYSRQFLMPGAAAAMNDGTVQISYGDV